MQYHPLIPLLFLAAGVLLALAVYGLASRRPAQAVPFGLAMICCAVWALAYALEILSLSLELKTIWARARIVPIALFPVFWFWLALCHSGRPRGLNGRRLLPLLIVPALSSVAALLPGSAGRLFRFDFRLPADGAFHTLAYTNGPWFYVHLVYSFLLLIGTLVLLAASLPGALPLYRRQTRLLIAGIALPMLSEALYQLGLTPAPGLNLSPFALTASGILIGLAIFRYRLLDLLPVAGGLLVQVMEDPVVVLDPDGRLVLFNPAAARLISPGGRLSPGTPLARLPGPWAAALGALKAAGGGRQELRVASDEGMRLYDAAVSPITDGASRRLGDLLLLHDLTELRHSQQTLQLALDSANEGLWDWYVPTGRAYFSPRWFTMLGYSPGEFTASYATWKGLVHPQDAVLAESAIRDCVDREQEGYAIEFRMRTRQGEWRWILSRGRVIERTANGTAARLVGTHVDITEYKVLEQRLRASEAKFRSFIEQAAEGIMLTDEQGILIEYNPAMQRILGLPREEAIGQPAWSLMQRLGLRAAGIPAEAPRLSVEERVRQALASGQTPMLNQRLEAIVPGAAGRPVRHLEHYIFPICTENGFRLGSITHDVTEQRRAQQELRAIEERLVQAQKMEAVGRLAGGIAHDFNNLLTVIKGYAEMVREALPGASPQRDGVEEIARAAERAAAMTAQLLAFGRRQVMQPRVVSLNALVRDMRKMLQPVVGEDVELRVTLFPDLGNIRTDPGQMEQVITNLALNARDAMPAGGRITLATSNCEVRPQSLPEHPELKPGRYVLLQVSDTGCGMEPGVLAHLFEPFFSTKEKGKGTGLGLSTAYGIIKQSGGYIYCTSEVGRGTRFDLYFPVEEGGIEEEPSPAARRPASGVSGATVLLVEDEAGVRGFARTVLSAAGYRVLEADLPAEAVRVARAADPPVDLLLTDVVMPGMNGRELAARLTAAHPRLKVLFMSGYTENAIAPRGVLERGVAFLQKPFGAGELLAQVSSALPRPPADGSAGQ